MFATHQERLPKELAARGIDTMDGANRYLAERYRAAFNEEFAVPAAESGTAFVPFIGPGLADVLCEHHERTVGRDNCVSFEGKRLQIPAQAHRCHFIKARVRVHRYPDGRMAVFHGPRKLAEYESDGSLVAAGAPRRPVPQWHAERPLCGALDLGTAHLRVSGAGLPAWTTRCALTHSRCRPSPRLAPLPAAAVGAILPPRWTPSEVRARIGNRPLSAADRPAPSGARSAH